MKTALYSEGVLLLAEAAREGGRSRLLVAARDLTTPPTATATGAHLGTPGLRETVAELDMLILGQGPCRSLYRSCQDCLCCVLPVSLRAKLYHISIPCVPDLS